ncbi:nitroreductase family protein [Planctomicrobium sp. SH664]|uniref:nitroreductase family protein n=1 Tax=Planctomicrobium sp. SH664 TaxID=3448125 RepID=UPI003F5BC884
MSTMTLEFSPSGTDLAQLMRTRRTINDFKPDVPPRELVLQAIEVARWAPNHKMTEPWRFHLLGPETAHTVVELNTTLIAEKSGIEVAVKKRDRWAHVPGWLAVSVLRAADPVRETENYAAVSCAIQNLSLFLWSQGIGSKWSTGPVTRHPDFYRLLGIDPAQEQVAGLIWYGYPSFIPEMRRQSVSEITKEHP